MRTWVKRSFAGGGLITLAMPGLLAEHVQLWAIVGAGFLAGLIAGQVVRDD